MNLKLGGILRDLATTLYNKVEHHSQVGLAWAEIGAHDLTFGVFVGYRNVQSVVPLRIRARLTKINCPNACARSDIQSILELCNKREKQLFAISQMESDVHEVQSF